MASVSDTSMEVERETEMEIVLQRRDELEHERLDQLQAIQSSRKGLLTEMYHLLQAKENPALLFQESKNEQGMHRFLYSAAEMFLGQSELRQKANMADVAAMIEHRMPTPPPPLLDAPELENLGSLPGVSYGVEKLANSEREVVDGVGDEAKVVSPVEVVDLTQDDAEEVEEDDHDDVILLDAPPGGSVPQPPAVLFEAMPQASSPSVLPPDTVVAHPPSPTLPQEQPLEQSLPIMDHADEDAEMQDVEEQPTDVPRAKPLTQNNSEDFVMNMIADVTSEPLLPLSRTTSGHYSLTAVPPSILRSMSYTFEPDTTLRAGSHAEAKARLDTPRSSVITSQYSLPPLGSLPAEFQRKSRSSRLSRRREKDKDGKGQSDWVSIGVNKWGAIIRANPVFKRMSKATKCLSTKDWNIAMAEVRLLRTLEKVEQLKEAGRWSFRQPKKQRGVGGLTKTHRDYLLDEMKWMRTDFREERRWKLTLAYNLALAVMAWHEAGDPEERVRRGICVLWKRPRDEEIEKDDAVALASNADGEVVLREEEEDGEDSKQTSTPGDGDGYGSDEESDDEQEKEQQDVLDVLDPSVAIQDELDRRQEAQDTSSQDFHPKIEDVEDLSALQSRELEDKAMVVDSQLVENALTLEVDQRIVEAVRESKGMKETSDDPILGANVAPLQANLKTPLKMKAKSSTYASLRERIVYSDFETPFIDLDEYDLSKGMAELSTDDFVIPPPPDLVSIFPDLHPYGMLNLAPPAGEGKRKSDRRADKDDPNKRAEDTTYTKLVPTSEIMYHKATLLGPLDPANHWSNGEWHDLEETAVVADFDTPHSRLIDESLISSSVFGYPGPTRPGGAILRTRPPHGMASLADVKVNSTGALPKQRQVDLSWTPQDDAVLKQLTEKYPANWLLIAEAFNSCRLTISTEKRTALDCYLRVNRGYSSAVNEEPPTTPQASTSQMTTRGIKRSFSTAMSASGINLTTPTTSQVVEPKKRRHSLMNDVLRRAAKKREAAQKAQSAQRKPAQMHDTHTQYSKMPKYTPAELSRMKAESDSRAQHENMVKRRQEELTRQQMAQQQQMRMQPNTSPSAPNTATRPQTNGIPAAQGVPQIRSQVNISQQQRISSQMASRLGVPPNQQALQAQARAMIALQAAAAQNPQSQVTAQQPSMPTSLAANVAPALSTAYGRNSSSPALPQQSPPLLAAVATANAASPRPPSAQAHANMVAQQAAARNSVTAATLAHYYPPSANVHTQQMMSPEQADQAHRIQLLLQQQQVLQQQRQAQQAAQQASHNGPYPQA